VPECLLQNLTIASPARIDSGNGGCQPDWRAVGVPFFLEQKSMHATGEKVGHDSNMDCSLVQMLENK
jgi:hypothetical protein